MDAANLPHTSVLMVTITVTVALSVIAHGISAAPLAGALRHLVFRRS